MKIQCDVCNKNHASLFCTADEAALCDACDHRVHHANKLASKHQRFSLTHPSSKHFPLCDVCQERRAYVFCQQDRAILCKECDLPIHAANEHTKKHNRFLLTGTKLSAAATLYSSLSVSVSPPSNSKPQSCPVLDSSEALIGKTKACPSTALAPPTTINKAGGSSLTNQNEGAGFPSSSSISEYLINTIPGWQFEDFLDSPSAVPFASFSKNQNGNDMSSLFDGDIEEGNLVSFSAENMGGIWVPQAPSSSLYSAQIDQHIGYRETREASSRSRFGLGDDNFIVPQMSPPNNIATKRSRLLW